MTNTRVTDDRRPARPPARQRPRGTALTALITAAVVPALVAIGVARAGAQVPWESPQLLSPHSPAGVGLHYVDFGLRPLDGTGVLLTVRRAEQHGTPGFRVAATYPRHEGVRLSGGADVVFPLYSESPTFPLDIVWTSGLGAAWGEYLAFGLPVGASAGRRLDTRRVTLMPYTSARMVLETYAGSGRPDDRIGLALAAEAGTDLAVGATRTTLLRLAMSLGDRRALLVGLHRAPGIGPTRR